MSRILFGLSLAFAFTGCSNKFKGDGDDPSSMDDDDDDGGSDGDGDDGGDDGGDEGGDGGGDDGDDGGDQYTDDDGDGYTEDEGDCDDDNADVAPNQAESCDGLDNDCDGQIDDGASDGETYYLDSDGDGYGDPATASEDCSGGGYVTNADDCDDTEYSANPDGTEINWNGIDEDCDGSDVDTDACVAEAINATSEEMTEALWVIEPYNGTYYETITGFSLAVADWQIANQYLYMSETSTSASQVDTLSYDTTFDVDVGMNDSAYSGAYFYDDDGDLYLEGPFFIDVELDELYEYLGLEFTTYCDAWVTPVGHSFLGSLDLTINETSQTVSGDAQLESNRTALSASDIQSQSVTGEAVCQITVIDAIIDQLGYGDTLGILDETFETTLTGLETTYEDTLETNIDLYCSAS